MNAVVKESQGYFYESYRVQAKFELFSPSDVTQPSFWDGTGVPLFVLESMDNSPSSRSGGAHDTNRPGAFEETSIVSLPNFPFEYPWAWVGYKVSQTLASVNARKKNPYGLTNVDDVFCFVISHEIFEVLGDDDTRHYRLLDETSIAAPQLYFAKTLPNGDFDSSGYTIDETGTAHFPKLLDVYPKFKALLAEEAGDAVSLGLIDKFNSFVVDGYRITNYPTRQSFNCYDTTEELYDRMGNMQYPCIPYGGGHQGMIFNDMTNGVMYEGTITSWGPLNGSFLSYKVPFATNITYVTLKKVS